jgi:Right handed beta helix region
MTKESTAGLAALLAVLALAPAAAATTTTLDATADSRVEAAHPSYNYGPFNLKAQQGAIRSYLRFNLSTLPAEPITQATLRVAPISGSSQGLESFAVEDSDWTEDEITWNNQPGPRGEPVGRTGAWSAGPDWVSMDVTSIVAGGTGDVSMLVEAVDAGGPALLKSRHWGRTGPKLDIVTAPTLPSPGCNRVAGLAAAQSEIAAGRDACLADGTYSGPLTLSTSATSRVTLSAEHEGQAQISGLVTLNDHTAIDGLDLTSPSDCVRIPTAQTDIAVLDSALHDCGRDGIRWARPALDGSNESRDVLVSGNVIRNVGWNSMTVRGDAATVTDNELTGSANDAVTLWGDGHVFRSNYIHDYSNSVGNHNDAFQTWGGGDDGFRGTPVTRLLIEANRIVDILGSDAHGLIVSGENSDLTIRRNLWWNIGSHALNLQPGQTDVDELYNTFVSTGIVQYNAGTSGRIVGNIFAGVGPYYVTGCACLLDHNLATTWAPDEPHGLQADPMFVGASDFHLQATSPAVDSGDPATVPPIDIDGKPADGVPDRGAYER